MIGFNDRPNVVIVVVMGLRNRGGQRMRYIDKDDSKNFNFSNWKSGVDISEREGEWPWQALRKDQDFGFGCAKFEVSIRPPAGVVRWEFGGGSAVQGIMEQARRPLHCPVTVIQSFTSLGLSFPIGKIRWLIRCCLSNTFQLWCSLILTGEKWSQEL